MDGLHLSNITSSIVILGPDLAQNLCGLGGWGNEQQNINDNLLSRLLAVSEGRQYTCIQNIMALRTLRPQKVSNTEGEQSQLDSADTKVVFTSCFIGKLNH